MPDLSHDLLLLITNLSQHKDKSNIISLFTEGIRALFPYFIIEWRDDQRDPEHKVFAVQTRDRHFGYLVVESDKIISGEVRSLIQNAVQMVAVILERVEHENALEEYRDNLEQLVEAKTHDLVVREIKYRNLYESMIQGVVYQDTEGEILSANPAAERILGLTLAQMQGRSSTDPRWHSIKEDGSDFPGEEHPAMLALRFGKEVLNVVMGVFKPSLEDITWINIHAIPQFREGEKKPYQVFTTFEDITEKKRNADGFSVLSKKQESILAAIPDIIMEVNEHKVYTWANEAGQLFFGMDVIGTTADSYFEGEQDTYNRVQPLFNGSEDVIYVESWQRRKDGVKRLLAWWCHVLKNEKGEVLGAISTARDITENRQLEISLAERNRFIESLVNLQPDIVYIYDLVDHKNVYSNNGVERILGYSVAEIQEMDSGLIELLMHPDDWPVYLNEVIPRYLNAADGEQITHQYRMRHKSGEWRWLSSTEIIYNRSYDGTPKQIFGVIHDITDRKMAEEEVLRLNTELEQRVIDRTAQLELANKEMEAFAYSISHDLRAPLRAINGYTTMLKDRLSETLDEEGKRILGVIILSTVRMDRLITDLLNLSRITRGPLQVSLVNMTEMVESVFQELARQEEKLQIELEIRDLPEISADPNLMRQVWTNLLSNSMKYTAKLKKRTISIGTSQETGTHITYFVKDNGIGFDPRFAEKIFGVFQRLHTDEEYEGTGVGLAIVQRIIQRQGGKVWAEGKEGKGATFYFTLPKRV